MPHGVDQPRMGAIAMSEETPTPADVQPNPAATGPEAPARETDWKAEARKWEDRAKANKAAADRLAEIEDAQKSEQEKAAERLAEAEADAQKAKQEALRFRIAAKHQISDEDAELFLTGSDEGTLTRQAERLAARNEDAGSPRAPRPDLNQGRVSSGAATTADLFASAIADAMRN